MAIAQVSTAPSRELYDAVVKQLDLEGQRPSGLLVHAASEMPSGEIQIIDVYESREALEAFTRSRLFPAFAAAGVEDIAMRAEPPVAYEAFDLVV